MRVSRETIMHKTLFTFTVTSLALLVILTGCPSRKTTPAGSEETKTQLESTSGEFQDSSPSSIGEPEYEIRPGGVGDTSESTVQGLPPGWPEDIPVMEGFSEIKGKNASGMLTVSAVSTLPADEVQEFYSDLPGWTKDPNVPWVVSGPSRTLKLVKGVENLVVNINVRNNRTELTLTYFVK